MVFDPPHLLKVGDSAYMALKYGKLTPEWKAELGRGFDECWRVLKSGGTLIFKWAEIDIKLTEILKCFSQKPLITQNTANKSHWCVFFK